MGISGNLKTMVLADLLQWVSHGMKTGTLVLDGEKHEKRIYFDKGHIVSASSADPKDDLGRFLVSRGMISEDQLQAVKARQKDEALPLAQLVVTEGLLPEEHFSQTLTEKVAESVYDVFTWEAAEFRFLDGELPEESRSVELDVQWIILEGSRRQDEWTRIQDEIHSPMSVPVSVADLTELEVEEETARVLELVDDDSSVEEIADASCLGLVVVGGIVAEYVRSGHLKVVRPRVIKVVKESEGQARVSSQPSGAIPIPTYIQQVPVATQAMPNMGPPAAQGRASSVAVGGQTLHFANTGGAPAAPQAQAPAPAPAPPAPDLVQEIDDLLRARDFAGAAKRLRQAQEGGSPAEQGSMQRGEERIRQALDRDGVGPSSIPKLKCGMEELTGLDISPQEGFMLTRVDGKYDIKSILKISPMPELDAQLLFWRLRQSGHVAFKSVR